jgi:hypothetical protein
MLMNDKIDDLKSNTNDEVFGSVNELAATLRTLDDRGLVLSLAAFAEEALGALLTAFMIPSDATEHLIDGFNAPLGTLSSRIKATYSLGLITKDQFDDLECLRKIRNEFAHTWRGVSLERGKVPALVKKMCFSAFDETYPETAHDKVRISMSSLLVELQSLIHQMPIRNKQAKVSGSRLITMFHGDADQQLKQAREKLASTKKKYEAAEGDEKAFCLMLLKRVEMQCALMITQIDKSRKADATAVLAEVAKYLGADSDWPRLPLTAGPVQVG